MISRTHRTMDIVISSFIPRRGDVVEQWMRQHRDIWPKNTPQWGALDDLLDEYRLHAYTRTPLTEEVEEPGYE